MKIGKPDQRFQDKCRYFFLGNPLKNNRLHMQALGAIAALALFAVDALSSIAYATEEIMLVLAPHPFLYPFALPISGIIIVLMGIIITSYIQTIKAFPHGGGAYTVAKTYLGDHSALLAASALLIDYILTVAVSVCAGVRSLASAFPWLYPYSTVAAVLFVGILCLINLRGMKESARLLVPPVYAYIVLILLLCLTGVVLMFVGSSNDGLASPESTQSFETLTKTALTLILLRAFAGGCTAMTGIEAIANAGSALKKPQFETASKVLIAMGCLLAIFLMGITWIATVFHFKPLEQESLISQITKYCWGDGFFYMTLQILIAFILLFAANTAFAGFPKLVSILAKDSWLPRQLSALGDRLVFSNGIVLLGMMAVALIVFFQGNTHLLIPLYAVGVFLAFTLSQLGMAIHWRHQLKKSWHKMVINTIGMLCTFLVLCITLEAKFFDGAFVVILVLPLFWLLLTGIHKHYTWIDRSLNMPTQKSYAKKHSKYFTNSPKRVVVVPVARFHRGTFEALRLAREISTNVTALTIHIGESKANIQETCDHIQSLGWDIQMEVIYSPYRSIIQPVVDYVHALDKRHDQPTVIILPEFVLGQAWQEWLLHNQTARNIQKALRSFETLQGEARVLINVPYYLSDFKP